METVLLVVQFFLAASLIVIIVVFQRSSQDGSSGLAGGGTMGGLFTARGSANLLTRTTAVLATLFILNSLTLGYIASSAHHTGSVLDQIAPNPVSTAPAAPAVPSAEPAAPTPAAPSPSELKIPEAQPPATPPQVPLAR